uniref:uncharacterized protein LOC120334539 n=1 Tax=Styela clava TaxID=7725 RepID=UPI0019399EC8|nr:uncharacterized protein LOC120334539 [Styela clava]
MMNRIIFLCVVLACVWKPSYAKKKCVLPSPQKINWSRLTGKWYNILNRKTPGDRLVKCLQLRDFEKNKAGFSYVIEDYHLNTGTYGGVKVNFKLKKSGIYTPIPKVATGLKWLKIVGKDTPHRRVSKPVKHELMAMSTSNIVFLTDYKNYVMDIRCSANGEKMIWVMSRNPHPGPEDILRITNKLNKIGRGWNDFPLFVTGCTKTSGLHNFKHA